MNKKKRKKIYVLANPASGFRRSGQALQAARTIFTMENWDAEIRLLNNPHDLELSAKKAKKEKAWGFVVCGGDGTLNTALKPLIGSSVRFGLIPMGTGNGFARGLNLPFDPLTACRMIAQGKTKAIDIGLANGHPFANIFGTGMDAWIGQTANHLRFLTRISGFFRYFVSGLISSFTFKPKNLIVTVGKRKVSGLALMAAVANAPEYGLGVKLAPLAKPDDGLFEMIFLPKLKPWQYLSNFPRLYTGKPLSGSTLLQGKSFTIEQQNSDVPLPFHVDGEIAGHLPVTITLKTKAIKLLVP